MTHTFDLAALTGLAPLDRVRRCDQLLDEANRLKSEIGEGRRAALVAARETMSVADIAEELGTSQAAVYKTLGRMVDPDLLLLRELVDFAHEHFAIEPRDARQMAAALAGKGQMRANAQRFCALASANRGGDWVQELRENDPERWRWYTARLARISEIATHL